MLNTALVVTRNQLEAFVRSGISFSHRRCTSLRCTRKMSPLRTLCVVRRSKLTDGSPSESQRKKLHHNDVLVRSRPFNVSLTW